ETISRSQSGRENRRAGLFLPYARQDPGARQRRGTRGICGEAWERFRRTLRPLPWHQIRGSRRTSKRGRNGRGNFPVGVRAGAQTVRGGRGKLERVHAKVWLEGRGVT